MAEQNLDVVIRAKDEISINLKQIESNIIRFVGSVSAALAGLKLVAFPISEAAEFQKELINVAKTTEFSRAGIDLLGKELLELSTALNVSAVDLAKIAAIAGQLGLGTQGPKAIAEFTKVVARFSTVLDVSVEESANAIARLSSIFHQPIENAEKLSSALNEVSNNSTASGKALIDISRRIGNAGNLLQAPQTIALAATGVDLGESLETIGTSFTKFFANMQTKAGDFANVMGEKQSVWIDRLKTNGVDALKAVLAKLRELEPVSRSQAIQNLFGGGKLFGLANKLVNDASDSVLNKNLTNAISGFESGTSSIIEQQKVLASFSSQLTILGNDFTKLGIEIGTKALPFLTELVKELQNLVNSTGVREFFFQIAEGIGAAAKGFITFAQSFSDAAPNVTNLVNILGKFTEVKIAETLIKWIDSLNLLGKASNATGALITGLTRLASPIESIKAAGQGIRDYADSITFAKERELASIVATDAKTIAIEKLAAAEKAQLEIQAAQQRLSGLRTNLESQKVDLLFANPKESAAKNSNFALAQRELAFEKIKQIEIAGEQEIAQRRSEIQTRNLTLFRQREAALRAEVQARVAFNVAAVEEETAKIIALNTKSFESYKAMLAERVALTEAAIAKELALETAKAAEVRALNAEAATANAIEQEAIAARSKATAAAIAGLALNIRNAFAALGSFLLRAFNIGIFVLLIKELLDMFGLLPKVTEQFFKLAEAIGFVSKARDKELQQQRERTQALQDEVNKNRSIADEFARRQIDTSQEAIEKRRKNLQNVLTKGPVSEETLQTNVNQAISGSIDANDAIQANKKELEGVRPAAEIAQKSLDDLNKKYKETADKVRELTLFQQQNKLLASDPTQGAEVQAAAEQQIEATKKQIAILNDLQAERAGKVSNLQKIVDSAGESQLNGIKLKIDNATKFFSEKAGELNEIFTNSTARIVSDNLLQLKSTEQELAKQQGNLGKLNDKLKTESPESDKAAGLREDIIQTDGLVRALSNSIGEQRKDLADARLGLTEVEKVFVDNILSKLSAEQIQKLNTILDKIKETQAALNKPALTGNLLPKQIVNTDADRELNLQRGRARAILDLEKAKAEAQFQIVKASGERIAELDRASLEQGLITQVEFAQRQAAIQRDILQGEISEKRRALEQAQKTASTDNNEDGNTRLNAQKDIARLQAEITIALGKLKAIPENLVFALAKANTEITDEFLQLEANLFTLQGRFGEAAADQLISEFRLKIAQIKTLLASAVPGDKERGEQELNFVVKTIGIKQALADLQTFTAKVDAAEQALAAHEAGLNLGATRGARTELEAQEGIVAARKQYAEILAQTIPQQQEFARLTTEEGSAARDVAITKIELLKQKVLELRDAVTETAKSLNEGFKTSLEDAIQSITEGTKSLGDAFRDFGKSVLQQINKVAIKQLVESSFGDVLNGSGSFGDIFSKALGVKDDRGAVSSKPLFVEVVNKLLEPIAQGRQSPPSALTQEQVLQIVTAVKDGTFKIQGLTDEMRQQRITADVKSKQAEKGLVNLPFDFATANQVIGRGSSAVKVPSFNSEFDTQAEKLKTQERFGLDGDFFRFLALQESSFNPKAVSSAGNKGIFQLGAGVISDEKVKNAFDPIENIDAGMRHFVTLLEKNNNDINKSLAEWNDGVANVAKHARKGEPLPDETIQFVKALGIDGVVSAKKSSESLDEVSSSAVRVAQSVTDLDTIIKKVIVTQDDKLKQDTIDLANTKKPTSAPAGAPALAQDPAATGGGVFALLFKSLAPILGGSLGERLGGQEGGAIGSALGLVLAKFEPDIQKAAVEMFGKAKDFFVDGFTSLIGQFQDGGEFSQFFDSIKKFFGDLLQSIADSFSASSSDSSSGGGWIAAFASLFTSSSFRDGGMVKVKKYAEGGKIIGPGTGTSDSIPAIIDGKFPAAISTGEFIMPARPTQMFGSLLEMMRRGVLSMADIAIRPFMPSMPAHIPLTNRYAGGGVVNGNMGDLGIGTQVNNVTVNVDTNSGSANVSASGTNAQDAAALGRTLSGVVVQELIKQQRPGGLLAK